MSRDLFLAGLEYLKRSNIPQARLLGGEPTMHPDFLWMVNEALRNSFTVVVFSNGLMATEILEELSTIPQDSLTLLINTMDPSSGEENKLRLQRRTMRKLGRRCSVGVTIHRRGQKLDYLFDYIRDYRLTPGIRLGIAHPQVSLSSSYLYSKFYSDVGNTIADFHLAAREQGVDLSLDCGFVPCMFPEERYAEVKALLENAGRYCSPNIDLLPSGEFIACYPLDNLKRVRINSEDTADELREAFAADLAGFGKLGIFPHCTRCPLFGSHCDGGCIAQKIVRLKNFARPRSRR